MESDGERWTLVHTGRTHEVEVSGLAPRTCIWRIDGVEIAREKTTDDSVVLAHPDEPDPDPDADSDDGPADARVAVKVRLPKKIGPTRMVTLVPATEKAKASARALLSSDGIDFEPEPGTKAARRQEWIRRHPHLHLVREVAGAGAGILIPLAILALIKLIPWPDVDIWLPQVDLPSIPWPDLPSIPWPLIDLPSIPWPDWTVPGWLEWLLDNLRYVVILTVAAVVAHREVKRRRRTDAERAAAATDSPAESDTADDPEQSR